MDKRILAGLSIAFGIALLLLVLHFTGIDDVTKILEIFSFYKFLLVFGFFFIIWLIILARWGIVLNAVGNHVPFSKLLPLRLCEFAVGYITPFSRLGGEPILAYLFKKECGISYKDSMTAIIANKALDFISGIIFASSGIALFIAFYGSKLPNRAIIIMITFMLILSGACYLFYKKINKKEGFFSVIIRPFKGIIHENIHKGIAEVESGLHNLIKRHKIGLVNTLWISLIIQLLIIANYKIIGLFLGLNLSFINLLIIFSFINLSFIIPIPGSLGSMEAASALVFLILGYSAGLGVAFALILRTFELTITGIGLIFSAYYGVKLKGINRNNQK